MTYTTAAARLATAAGLSQAQAAAATGPAFPIGFAPGAGTPTNAEIDDMVGRWNAKVLRCGISWDAMSSGINGTFDQTNGADNFVEYCCSKKIGVIFQVGSGPTNNGKMFVPATIIKYAQFCRAVMARYNGTTFASGNFVLSVSIGNEPNHAKWDDGVASGVGNNGKGAAYAELMIRIEDPLFNNARGITNCPPIQIGGLGGESFRVGIPSSMFTDQAYSSITIAGHAFPDGWKTAYQIFDQHPYSYPVLPSRDTSDGWWQMVNVIRPKMVAKGDSAKRICISEVGFPTNPNTVAEYEKARIGLDDAIAEATKLGYIDSFCWFSYMNNNKPPGPGVGSDNFFGIVLNNAVPANAVAKTGTTTPGYADRFAELAAGGGTTNDPPDADPLPVILGLCASGTKQYAANVGARPAGVKIKRIDVNWWTAQQTNPGNKAAGQNDTFDWSYLDAILSAANTNGYKVIVMCAYTPPWAGGDGDEGHNYPRGAADNYPDFANFCRGVAARAAAQYPNGSPLAAIEFWNEPNQEFLTPNSIANFAKLCQGAQDAIKDGVVVGRADRTSYPDMITIAGGTGAAPAVGNQFRHWNWTRDLVAAKPNCADHFGIHAYSGGCVLGTNNGYDPAKNDIAKIRTSLDNAGRTDAQIVNTESGFFTRADSTTTNTSDTNNCGHYGSGPGDQKQQVTVTDAATLLTDSVDWWMTHATTYNLGPFLYYEQDNSQAADLFNSGGLYSNAAGNFNGPAKTNTGGTPVLLNAFLAALGGTTDTTDPTVVFSYPPDNTTFTGNFSVLGLVSDDTSPGSAIVVKLYKNDGATLVPGAGPNQTMVYSPGGVPLGFNEVYDGQPGSTWPDGTYQLRIKATDQAGNVTTSARRTITIDTGQALPQVNDVSPSHGPTSGGTRIVVSGSGLTGATAVTVGGNPCTDIRVGAAVQHIFPLPPLHLADQSQTSPDTILDCLTPAGTAGTKNLRVTTPAGQSPVSATAKFTYDDDTPPPPGSPTITLLDPTVVALVGGDTVTVTGTDCDSVTSATVDGNPATSVTPLSPTSLTFITPAGSAPGNVDVRITNPTGTSAPKVLTYLSEAPEMGPITAVRLADGTVVTDFTNPVHVSGTIRVYFQGTDDVDQQIPETWIRLPNGTRLGNGHLAPDGTYYADVDTLQLPFGAAHIDPAGRDSEGNVG